MRIGLSAAGSSDSTFPRVVARQLARQCPVELPLEAASVDRYQAVLPLTLDQLVVELATPTDTRVRPAISQSLLRLWRPSAALAMSGRQVHLDPKAKLAPMAPTDYPARRALLVRMPSYCQRRRQSPALRAQQDRLAHKDQSDRKDHPARRDRQASRPRTVYPASRACKDNQDLRDALAVKDHAVRQDSQDDSSLCPAQPAHQERKDLKAAQARRVNPALMDKPSKARQARQETLVAQAARDVLEDQAVPAQPVPKARRARASTAQSRVPHQATSPAIPPLLVAVAAAAPTETRRRWLWAAEIGMKIPAHDAIRPSLFAYIHCLLSTNMILPSMQKRSVSRPIRLAS
jgi:hypothetical protein